MVRVHDSIKHSVKFHTLEISCNYFDSLTQQENTSMSILDNELTFVTITFTNKILHIFDQFERPKNSTKPAENKHTNPNNKMATWDHCTLRTEANIVQETVSTYDKT